MHILKVVVYLCQQESEKLKLEIMTNYKIISEEFMIQKTSKGLVTKREFKTISEEVVGKWVIMAQLESGILVFGTNKNKKLAIKEIESQC